MNPRYNIGIESGLTITLLKRNTCNHWVRDDEGE